jgi:hypothetical protein
VNGAVLCDPLNFDNKKECQDSDNGSTDTDGSGCAQYGSTPSLCGAYDDADFTSTDMCCTCQEVFKVSLDESSIRFWQ